MEAVIFDGKEYVKASVVAERFKYTQDYLGQLCRGKKVDARLVGRAWYINLDSLTGHKKARYKVSEKAVSTVPSAETEFLTHSAKGNYLSRIDVEPVLKKKTVKIIRNEAGKLSEFPVKYENDDYSLIPKVSREAVYKSLPVLPAGAENLAVKPLKESVRVTSFKAEPLPEVYLKGVLKVDGIPEVVEDLFQTEEVFEVPKLKLEVEHNLASVDKNQVMSSAHTPEKTITDIKKPLKIKLYRNQVALESPNTSLKSPVKTVSERTTDTAPVQPFLGEQKGHGRQILVKRVAETEIEASNVRNKNQKSPEKIEFIPFATTKALLLLTVCVALASSIVMLGTELSFDAGTVTSLWTFSPEKIESALASIFAF